MSNRFTNTFKSQQGLEEFEKDDLEALAQSLQATMAQIELKKAKGRAEDYLPTDADILKLGGATPDKSGVEEHRLTMGELSLHMFDASSQRSERKKWIHQFEGCNSIVFFVDVSQYDEHPPGELNQNKITESLFLFDSVINSRWFDRASITLLLCNVGRFKEKLQSKPLVNYFPDYTSGSDFNRSAKYILCRFNQLNHGHLDLYPHFCDPSDDYIPLIWSGVKESIIQENLKIAGIIPTRRVIEATNPLDVQEGEISFTVAENTEC
ncbi:hypothetical protein V502_10645 [Pseudogymnoascus sp. VKM F-4520 (FW-2644)]|nr:hypothetical protein V502_10645 [Pseudogymnoascus sp. VKM F-4520 (FW-2644)]